MPRLNLGMLQHSFQVVFRCLMLRVTARLAVGWRLHAVNSLTNLMIRSNELPTNTPCKHRQLTTSYVTENQSSCFELCKLASFEMMFQASSTDAAQFNISGLAECSPCPPRSRGRLRCGRERMSSPPLPRSFSSTYRRKHQGRCIHIPTMFSTRTEKIAAEWYSLV